MEPFTLLAAFAPVLVEAGKAAVQRYLQPDTIKPTTVAEFVQLRQLDLQQFQALQGDSAPTYQWVGAVRQLQRPVFAAGVLIAWAFNTADPMLANMASAVGFYLFGDRTLFHMRGRS